MHIVTMEGKIGSRMPSVSGNIASDCVTLTTPRSFFICMEWLKLESTLCLKTTDIAHYNFNAHQPILLILAQILRSDTLSNGDLLSNLS